MTTYSQTIDTFCELLSTGNEVDRCYASRALGVLGADKAVASLIERLRDEDIDVCVDAAEALGKIGVKEAIPSLTESLENDSSSEVCTAVVRSLGKFGGPEAAKALLRVVTERPEHIEWDDDWDTWWDIQLEAVKALGHFAAEEAVEPLLSIIDDDAQQDIESDILAALAKIPGKGVAALIARLQNQRSLPKHRRRAARALGNVATVETLYALGQALKDEAPEVRAEAASALANGGGEKYLSLLLLMLRDPSAEVRDATLKASLTLIEQGITTESVQAALLPLLQDPSSQVRGTLFDRLAQVIGSHPLIKLNFEAVTQSLDDKNAETAAAACLLLGNSGNQSVLPALIRILKDRNGHPMVRREAALAIGKLGQISNEILEELTQAVGDRQQTVRLSALSALMALQTQGAAADDPPEDQRIRRPLEIIIAAVNGEINPTTVSGKTKEKPAPENKQRAQDNNATPEQEKSTAQEIRLDETGVKFNSNPMSALSENSTETHPAAFAENALKTAPLPETSTPILQAGEIKGAQSTLDAIAMDNVEATLNQAQLEQADPQYDANTQTYLEVVEENKEEMQRIRSSRRFTVEQDVRRLGIRVLAESEDPVAIDSLIQALNDDDSLILREATAAIGKVGLKQQALPQLMNAIGTLITQLSVGDLEQRCSSAHTLGILGNKAALNPLMDALQDKVSNVRIQSLDALASLIVSSPELNTADHMVVLDIPASTIVRRIMVCLDDEEISLRVAAARALVRILNKIEDPSLSIDVIEKIIISVSRWSGEEARSMAQALSQLDKDISAESLLTHLKKAQDSVKRSVYIEMLEEILNSKNDLGGLNHEETAHIN